MINAKNFIRNVEFTTTSANYELLTNAGIVAALQERLGLNSSEEVAKYIADNKLNIYFEIYFSSKQYVSVNESTYYPAMTGDLYYSGDFINGCKSIRIQNSGISGMIAFQVK